VVAGAVLSAFTLVPLLILAIVAFARLQERVIDFVLDMLTEGLGLEDGDGSATLRFVISALLGGSLFGVAYVAILVGTHIATLVMLTVIGVTISLALTFAANLRSDEPTDLLSRLRFWDSDE